MSSEKIDLVPLLKVLALLKPALATKDYIPAFTHIKFDGDVAYAFNDLLAIQVRLPEGGVPVNGCVPGDALLKSLGSLTCDQVQMSTDDNGAFLWVKHATGKIKLPVLSSLAHPFVWPECGRHDLKLDESQLNGVKVLLGFTGPSDKDLPEMSGVVGCGEDSLLVWYASDNKTISEFTTGVGTRWRGTILLPANFCSQVLAAAKVFPDEDVWIYRLEGGVMAALGHEEDPLVQVFIRTQDGPIQTDFKRIISKYINHEKDLTWLECTPEFRACIGRQAATLGTSHMSMVSLRMHPDMLTISSKSMHGIESFDEVEFVTGDTSDKHIIVDPSLLLRAMKTCTHMAITSSVMFMRGEQDQLLHLIAGCTPARKQ